MARRLQLHVWPALGLVLALAGCKDTPSYRLRWALVDSTTDETHDVTKAIDCSRFGITAIRVRAFDPLDNLIDERFHACFAPGFEDPDELADGPEIRAGTYKLEVRGIQRDGEPWVVEELPPADEVVCNPGDEFPCGERELVCDCQEFVAREDETFDGFDTFRLVTPEDCDDGIDNDRDGVVDREDAGCIVQGIEAGAGVQVVQFTLRVTALDENPALTDCSYVELGALRVTATDADGNVTELGTPTCQLGSTFFFSTEIAGDDEQTIHVTGLDATGAPRTTTVEAGTVAPRTIGAAISVDFGAETFDPPLVASAKPILTYRRSVTGTEPREDCDPGGDRGLLDIENVTLQLLDETGAPVDGATLLDGMVPLDGSPLACPSGAITTQPLTWGGYRLVARALAPDGTICFRTPPDGEPLAPGAMELALDRVLVNGRPPAACVDCTDHADCGDGTCDENGICVPR